MNIIAESANHATIEKEISVSVYESDIHANLSYEQTEINGEYLVELELNADGLPIGYAPILLEFDTDADRYSEQHQKCDEHILMAKIHEICPP